MDIFLRVFDFLLFLFFELVSWVCMKLDYIKIKRFCILRKLILNLVGNVVCIYLKYN